MSELLSLPRAARRLGVTAKWLRTEADADRVPCLRADSRYLFDADAVTETLRQRAANPKSSDGRPSCDRERVDPPARGKPHRNTSRQSGGK